MPDIPKLTAAFTASCFGLRDGPGNHFFNYLYLEGIE